MDTGLALQQQLPVTSIIKVAMNSMIVHGIKYLHDRESGVLQPVVVPR